MTKSKSFYLVEGRKRLKEDRYIPNRVEHIIGLFKSEKEAENWIKSSGKEFYPPHHKSLKNHFFAIVELPLSQNNDYGGGYLCSFWSKEGKQV